MICHVGAKKEVSTLAILDNCSLGTLMKESILKNLGISGRKTEITIKKLNGNQNMRSSVVTGLKVSKNVHGEGVRWMNFLATFTREALPADAEEVATQEKARKWEYLKIIADKLRTETNMEIELLKRANFSKALKLEEVLPSKYGSLCFQNSIRMVCS